MVVSLPHPKAGAVTMMGVPIRLGDTPGAATVPPPLLGQHTEEINGVPVHADPKILTDLLRYPRAKIAALRAAGVV